MKIYKLNEGEMQVVKISKALRTRVIQQLYLLICRTLHQAGIFHAQDFPLLSGRSQPQCSPSGPPDFQPTWPLSHAHNTVLF